MSIKYLKDGNGQIIGSQNGDWIRDKSGKQIARFNQSSDLTLTSDAKRYGKGDQRIGALKEKK